MPYDTTRDVTTIEQVAAYHGCNVSGLRDKVRAIRDRNRRDVTLCRICEDTLPPVTAGKPRTTCRDRCRTRLSREGGPDKAW